MSNADSRTFFVVMALQIPEVICSRGMEHPQDPVGFLPVFDSEASARVHAGGRYQVHAIRLRQPAASRIASEPSFQREAAKLIWRLKRLVDQPFPGSDDPGLMARLDEIARMAMAAKECVKEGK